MRRIRFPLKRFAMLSAAEKIVNQGSHFGSRREPICKTDKQFRVAVWFVVTVVRLGGEIAGRSFEFVCLK
jgi:hypothetical protein